MFVFTKCCFINLKSKHKLKVLFTSGMYFYISLKSCVMIYYCPTLKLNFHQVGTIKFFLKANQNDYYSKHFMK